MMLFWNISGGFLKHSTAKTTNFFETYDATCRTKPALYQSLEDDANMGNIAKTNWNKIHIR